MKRVFIGLALSALMGGTQAQSLSTFDEITQQLSNGNEINALVNLSECVINDPNPVKIPVANWFVKPNTVVFTDKIIALDGEKYAHGRPPLPASGLVQKGTIAIDTEGKAQIILAFFDAGLKQKVMQDVTIQCQLNTGVKIFTRG